jgi:hypothetical protein
MFTLTLALDPMNRDFAVRPVCKDTDRLLVREIFRKEFYGSVPQAYPDEGLWEIYDTMQANEEEVFGAYLVSYLGRPLFLLEIHPPVQMDLRTEYLTEPGTVGIYCFYTSATDPMNLPGFRACISSLLDHPDVDQIVTTINHTPPGDARIAILEGSGFSRVAKNRERCSVYRCTQISFPLLTDNSSRFRKLLVH